MSDPKADGVCGWLSFGKTRIPVTNIKFKPAGAPIRRVHPVTRLTDSIGGPLPLSPYFCAICEGHLRDDPQGSTPLCHPCREGVVRTFGAGARLWAMPRPVSELDSILGELP